jgi:tetratricopeptide (TPR) repeat protein
MPTSLVAAGYLLFVVCLLCAGLVYLLSRLGGKGRVALSRRSALLLPATVFTVILAAVAAYPIAQRNAAGLLLLEGFDPADAGAAAASPALRAAAALQAGEPLVALAALAPPHKLATSLERSLYAQGLEATGDWRAAAQLLADEQPLPRHLLIGLLGPHLAELSSDELAFWRQQISGRDSFMLLDLANKLLLAGNYDAAEQWARALPSFEQSPDARRIVGQAYLGRGEHAEAERIFAGLYQEFPDPLLANLYGRTLLLAGRIDQAIPLLQAAAQDEEENQRAVYLADLALALAQSGRCTEASAAAEQAQALASEHALDSDQALDARLTQDMAAAAAFCP